MSTASSEQPTYDPRARRDTPLASKLKERIRRDGPLPLGDYMQACLGDDEHGYYVGREAIGAKGDFVTAPEITQIFGEIIGAWVAVTWQGMGAPSRFRLIELGPGRGTLMSDMLRVLGRVPPLLDVLSVEMIETSATLREKQQAALAGLTVPIAWHAAIPTKSSTPTIVVGNEFLDCIAPAFWIKGGEHWGRRTVVVDAAGQLQLGISEQPFAGKQMEMRFPDAAEGSVYEEMQTAKLIDELSRIADRAPLAGLLIDYGSDDDALGDTLQAVRAHAWEHVLTSPGEADLTAHVKFSSWAEDLAGEGLTIDGPVTQAEFLGRLGMMERASRLMSANPALAADIETGVSRVMAVPGMGDRFKALGLRSPQLPPPPGF